jgi:hypothetical protein
MERASVPSTGEPGAAHQHEVTRTDDPALHHVGGVSGAADRERRSTGDGGHDDQPPVPLPIHVRRDPDRPRHVVSDAHLVRSPAGEAAEVSAVPAHAITEGAAEPREQGEVVGRDRHVIAVDLLSDRAEGLTERPEGAGIELPPEVTQEGGRDGGGHAGMADASACAERMTKVDRGGESLVRHPAMMPRVTRERYGYGEPGPPAEFSA